VAPGAKESIKENKRGKLVAKRRSNKQRNPVDIYPNLRYKGKKRKRKKKGPKGSKKAQLGKKEEFSKNRK